MVKVFALDVKRPDLTVEQFHAHWRGTHAELALRITTQRRYVQSHRLPVEVAELAPCPYEGVAEIWFDDLAAFEALATDPSYTEYARKDEPNFLDMERLAFFPGCERVVLEGPRIERDTPLVKLLLLLRRKPGLTLEEFGERWRDPHGPLTVATLPGLRRHVQCPVVPEAYREGEPVFDGVSELWWDDVDAFRHSWQEALGDGRLLEDAAAFVDLPALTGLLAEEYRLVWS